MKESSGGIFYRNITVAETCLLWLDNHEENDDYETV
jgi:hypothetical protein